MKRIKLIFTVATLLFAVSSYAQNTLSTTSQDGYVVGFQNNIKGVTLVYDTSSTYSAGSSCKGSCYKTLSAGAQQWIDVSADPSGWAAPGYSICQSVTYDANGDPQCVGYLGYITVSLNHQSNQLKPGDDAQSKQFFPTLSFTKQDGQNLYSITSTYTPPQPPALNNAKVYDTGLQMRGTNLSGAEFGSVVANSVAPTADDAAYAAQYGNNAYRIPIRAEYALSSADSTQVNMDYINSVLPVMQTLLSKGYYVILDLHNYMRFCPNAAAGSCNTILTATQLTSIWHALLQDGVFGQLAKQYPQHLLLDLMNEPNGIDAGDVVLNYNQTIDQIRKDGFTNMLLLEGTSWSGLHDWADSGNATAFTQIVDPANNYAINVHQYFDPNYSGAGSTCVASASLLDNINAAQFASWLKDNKLKAIVTEFGAPDNQTCQDDMSTFVNYLQSNAYTADNQSGFIGWTTWSAGHAWANNYPMNFQGPSGVNFHLWKDLFVADNFISPSN